MLGYYIGYGLFETVGRPVLEFYGKDAYFEEFRARYNEWGAWAVLIAGVTPFPYKVITILSGSTALSLPVFMVASVVARGSAVLRPGRAAVEIRPADPRFHRTSSGLDVHAVRGDPAGRLRCW